MNTPPFPAGTSDADRLVDLMRFDGVSEVGLATISKIREVTLTILAVAKKNLDDGETLEQLYFFMMLDKDGNSQTGILPAGEIPTNELIGQAIREIAATNRVIAVVHVCEAWSLWGKVAKEEFDDIANTYGGQVRKHPKAVDVAFVNVVYNVLGRGHFMHKMFRVDETQTPRKVVDEADWFMGGEAGAGLQGRMVVPYELLEEIK